MQESPKKNDSPWVAFAIVGELGLEIAIPVVLLSRLGVWLDARYGSQPKLTIASFALAFIISATIVWKRAKAMQKMYEKL